MISRFRLWAFTVALLLGVPMIAHGGTHAAVFDLHCVPEGWQESKRGNFAVKFDGREICRINHPWETSDSWIGGTAYVADVNDPTTTVTMPAQAVAARATHKQSEDNPPPLVDAGEDQMLDVPMNQVAYLKGTATDDGNPGTGLTYAWSKVSGPGTVTFSDDDALETDATITAEGTYVLRLSVSDGVLTGTDDLTIKVHDNGRLTYPIIYTDIPKAMSDLSNYTNIYTLDLQTFGIYDDGTHAPETSAGINNALQYAKTICANRIVFPAGTYLIGELDPIVFDHEDTVVDLNGAALQMNTNGLSDTKMVIVDGATNFRLTNGTLKGDRVTHDYDTISSTHEANRLLVMESGYNMEFDHLTVRDGAGFSVVSHTGIDKTTIEGQYLYLYKTDLESGAFTSSGVKTADATKIRTINPMALTKFLPDMEFEFGQTWGYEGLYQITAREYQAYFYQSDMTFIEKKDCIQFKKVSIPTGAQYIHFEFNQSNIPTSDAGRLTDMEPPEHVHFHHNWIYRNRGLGQAFCGGQKWIIENNLYEENGTTINGIAGTLPAHGIDFEDGWDLMQDIVFRNNEFKNNNADMVVCAGSEMIFEGNSFEDGMGFVGRCENYVVRNNTVVGDELDGNNQPIGGFVQYATKTGNLSVHDNSYSNSDMHIENVVSGKPLLMIENDSLYNMRTIYGTEFVTIGCRVEWSRWIAGETTSHVEFDGCTFVGSSCTLQVYTTEGPDITLVETDCTGTLNVTGVGVGRVQ